MPITFASDIQLPRDPTVATHAATKQYVDTGLAGKAATTHTHTTAQITGLGTAATCNTGTASGNIPVLDTSGKLNASVIPASASAVVSVNGKTGTVVLVAADLSAIPTSEKAAANGVATLDASTKIPIAQLPTQATIANVTTEVTTGAAVYAHSNATTAHSSTATPTASRIAMWDANKRLKSDPPAATDDVATKGYADSLVSGYRTTITGNGTLTDFPVTHNLNSTEVSINVFKSGTTPTPVEVQYSITSATQITLSFAVAPITTDSYIVKVKV